MWYVEVISQLALTALEGITEGKLYQRTANIKQYMDRITCN